MECSLNLNWNCKMYKMTNSKMYTDTDPRLAGSKNKFVTHTCPAGFISRQATCTSEFASQHT